MPCQAPPCLHTATHDVHMDLHMLEGMQPVAVRASSAMIQHSLLHTHSRIMRCNTVWLLAGTAQTEVHARTHQR